MDLKVWKLHDDNSMVTDMDGHILFVGQDGEAIQHAIDAVDQSTKPIHHRVWQWVQIKLGLKGRFHNVRLSKGVFNAPDMLSLGVPYVNLIGSGIEVLLTK